MYCIDLKQMLDKLADKRRGTFRAANKNFVKVSFRESLDCLKSHPEYPKQENEHNALDDAKWNYELYNFLNS